MIYRSGCSAQVQRALTRRKKDMWCCPVMSMGNFWSMWTWWRNVLRKKASKQCWNLKAKILEPCFARTTWRQWWFLARKIMVKKEERHTTTWSMLIGTTLIWFLFNFLRRGHRNQCALESTRWGTQQHGSEMKRWRNPWKRLRRLQKHYDIWQKNQQKRTTSTSVGELYSKLVAERTSPSSFVHDWQVDRNYPGKRPQTVWK